MCIGIRCLAGTGRVLFAAPSAQVFLDAASVLGKTHSGAPSEVVLERSSLVEKGETLAAFGCGVGASEQGDQGNGDLTGRRNQRWGAGWNTLCWVAVKRRVGFSRGLLNQCRQAGLRAASIGVIQAEMFEDLLFL